MSRTRGIQIGLAVSGVALGVLAYQVQIDNLGRFTTPGRSLAIVAVGWSFLLAGLVAWSRRAGNRVGPLMIAAGFALLFRQLRYSHDPGRSRGAPSSLRLRRRARARQWWQTRRPQRARLRKA